MKPPPFTYRRAASIDEAVALLASDEVDAKVLAGGQSLTPMLNLRLTRPELLVDVGRLPGLRYIRRGDDGLHVGALTRHDQFEHYPAPLDGFDVLREAAPLIGHHPIRTRGTIGGSLAHGDGSAEWCILAVLLDATITAVSGRGSRIIEADGFFEGLFTTTLEPDELIVDIHFPRPRQHAALEEFARRHGDFAVVAAAVAFDVEHERVTDPRIVLGGVATTPVRCRAAEAVLDGESPTDDAFEAAGRAVADEIEPPGDLHAPPEVRRRMADRLVRRALRRAADANREGVSHAG
ncbi:MAG: FAD binding domain-containing protein [Nitriliruptoraceae bacterium]|nr:FAD binding domain-containing protein [Nitriliruptoraceae bacterium]